MNLINKKTRLLSIESHPRKAFVVVVVVVVVFVVIVLGLVVVFIFNVGPRDLDLKFGQNQVRKCQDIVVVVIDVAVVDRGRPEPD